MLCWSAHTYILRDIVYREEARVDERRHGLKGHRLEVHDERRAFVRCHVGTLPKQYALQQRENKDWKHL